MTQSPTSIESPAATLYLDLLQRCLTRSLFGSPVHVPLQRIHLKDPLELFEHPKLMEWVNQGEAELVLTLRNGRVVPELRARYVPELREEGRDWPHDAESMIGERRMSNLRACVTSVVRDRVPGDLVETGVWRGGAVIFMRAILKALGDETRRVWACDSFAGLPPPDPRYPADAGLDLSTCEVLAVSLEQVKANFARYGLLDDRVRFLKGWFKDTLPTAPIERIAVLRLDGDLYESTMDALTALYDRVAPGGYVIIDDYNAIPACRQAVEEFRAARGITDPVQLIDWSGIYWRRAG